MKLKADIKHEIATSNSYSTELEIQWQLLPQLQSTIKVISFDMKGHYVASYGQDRIVRISDARTVLVPMCLLCIPTSDLDWKGDLNCTQLCFSNCSEYLIGSFVLKTKKRKLSLEGESILILWHIPSQCVVYRLCLPIGIHFLHTAPSNIGTNAPTFLVASSSSSTIFVTDFFAGQVHLLLPREFSGELDDTKLLDEINLGWSINSSSGIVEHDIISIPVMSNRCYELALPPIVTLTLPVNIMPLPNETLTYGCLSYFDSSYPHGMNKLLVAWTRLLDQGTTLLSSIEISNTGHKLNMSKIFINTIRLSGVKVTAMRGNSLNTKLMVCMTDRVLLFEYDPFKPNAEIENSNVNNPIANFSVPEGKNVWVTSIGVSNQNAPLRLCGEFYGFPRLTKPITAQFLSMHFSRCSSDRKREIVLISTIQQVDRLQPNGELILWDYCGNSKVTNNKLCSGYTTSLFVTQLRSSIVPFDIIVQSRYLGAGGPQSIFGIDGERHLWYCSNLLFNSFPGPMFPPGYTVIEQVRSYKEQENELDNVLPQDELCFDKICITLDPLDTSPSVSTTRPELLTRLPLSFNMLVVKVQEKRSFSGTVVRRKNESSAMGLVLPSSVDGSDTCALQPPEHSSYALQNGGDDEEYDDEYLESASECSSISRKDVFPTGLFSFMTVPSRIKTGDFYNKVERDRAIGDNIRTSSVDRNLIQSRLQELQMESITMEVKHTIAKEKTRSKLLEKKLLRDNKRHDVLRDLFSMAIKKTEAQSNQVFDEVRDLMEMLLNSVVRSLS